MLRVNIKYPQDFCAAGWYIGIKDDPTNLDFGVIHSLSPCTGVAVFTRNNFPGWPVLVGREHAQYSRLRTVIVNSGNANVATSSEGLALVHKCCERTAKSLAIDAKEVLPASTGIIGRPLHILNEKMYQACDLIPKKIKQSSFTDFSQAICTTDAFPKTEHIELDNGICISGFAKGAGMMEPNMATMLAFLCTDAKMDSQSAKSLLTAVCARSFNRITVDSDTSTSDTATLLANGKSGVQVSFSPQMAEEFAKLPYPCKKEDLNQINGLDRDSATFLSGLLHVCVSLACMIVKDGEGATKIIELHIDEAQSHSQALKIGRSILNSPLCKTAIYGCDPNWGRIIMAIGKVFDEPIPIEDLKVYFGDLRLYPQSKQETDHLKRIADYLSNDKIVMRVTLSQGNVKETLWGCDLNENYVHLNSAYST